LTESERGQRIAEGQLHAFRLKMKEAQEAAGPLIWIDRNVGEIAANPSVLGDVVLVRKDIPTSYHLAVTVDDAAQGITLVTRGEDLFHASHLHRLLQALLGLPVPVWEHHSLILDEEGRRFAKRNEAVTLKHLRETGVKPNDILERIGL